MNAALAKLPGVLLTWMVARRTLLLFAVYVTLFTLSYTVAFLLRFDLVLSKDMQTLLLKSLPCVIVAKLAVFHRFGSFHGWWRFVTFADLVTLVSVSTLSLLVVASVDYFAISEYQIPRAVLLLDWGVSILLVGGLRSSWRVTREHVWPLVGLDGRRPVFLIGPGQGCEGLARQIHYHPELNYRVTGFLDEDPSHHGSRLGGIPFLGSPAHAVVLAIEHGVHDILVIANSICGKRLRNLVTQCQNAEIDLKIIPPVDQLLSGSFRLHIRDVNINDLLHREPVELDSAEIARLLHGRRVMVTGAGGSIGSEICRQILRHQPHSLILVERAENNLFAIEREMAEFPGRTMLHPVVADISDERRMRGVFERLQPEIVFHAAAHKHVPLMESNPGEAVRNNIFGTITLADLAAETGVKRFVMISTDKAVNPTSVMGVTKQIAERYICRLSIASDTIFVAVRFGNVLASTGSVVPIFQEQIRRGGPVTVTHPEMQRFFMTIPEASLLVLQAAAMGTGGEIFVLDMGEPVKIMDLAKDMIRLSGLSPDDIEIKITGVRPGEKLIEELHFVDEQTRATSHPKLRVILPSENGADEIADAVRQLQPLVYQSGDAIRRKLAELATEYLPTQPDPVPPPAPPIPAAGPLAIAAGG